MENYSKVQGSAGEGRICGMPWSLARIYGGGPSVEEALRQDPGVA